MRSTFVGSFLLGIGTIGMMDGIVFHQILQWHSIYMHTNRFNQIVSDGLFHLIVTIVIFIGAVILWKSDPSDSKNNNFTFLSGLFLGAGIFNFIEGILNHHILQIHHVKPGPNQFLYDILFDVTGIIIIIIGLLFMKISSAKG
ncbi:DUF2243 domain-containing protein [Ornithinibacillus bavariensis]|uniref:Membrane protein n=1 Tax=Ornithinibacillus bavariensis TaxID=545502 RepID=A0A920C763_9BACI|nr:DUF2243 domain-containing protein [Ornithinibacillus bavariensis]GIO26367.1 membrane protein [Ornithinibacillus bavariensis]HAM81606.1 DUF2243 domain-containing protein [Ornithinibacillus sp.]